MKTKRKAPLSFKAELRAIHSDLKIRPITNHLKTKDALNFTFSTPAARLRYGLKNGYFSQLTD